MEVRSRPLRLGLASLTCATAALALACKGGTSSSPAPVRDPTELQCIGTLQDYCCSDAGGAKSCIADFASASRCAAWPKGTDVVVYSSPCHGLTAVRLKVTGYSMFYVYDATAALQSVGDDSATANDPRADAIACGAGPSGFVVPADCSSTWLSDTGGEPCTAGTPAAASFCH